MVRARILIGVGVLAVISAGVGARLLVTSNGPTSANADDATLVALGRSVYAEHCATCHGENLEGQLNWRERDEEGYLPAPPHDATGHTWHHPDAMLFQITKEGTAAIAPADYKTNMIGFGDVLSDEEIWSVLAYIKSRWPEKERAVQTRITKRTTVD
jgi:mono/diheme cytochrome c family protein